MGQSVELSTKKVEIVEFKCLSQIDEASFEFEITCGSGTYIRSLCRDLAYKLGTYATMTFLERTQSGVFDLTSCVKVNELSKENLDKYLISIEDVFPKFGKIFVDELTEKRLLNGQTVFLDTHVKGKVFVLHETELVGLGEIKNKKIKFDVHLNEEKE